MANASCMGLYIFTWASKSPSPIFSLGYMSLPSLNQLFFLFHQPISQAFHSFHLCFAQTVHDRYLKELGSVLLARHKPLHKTFNTDVTCNCVSRPWGQISPSRLAPLCRLRKASQPQFRNYIQIGWNHNQECPMWYWYKTTFSGALSQLWHI